MINIKTVRANDHSSYEAFWENGVSVGHIDQDVDGYYKWWPDDKKGYLDEWFLITMYNKLKELNKQWNEQVMNDPMINGGYVNDSGN